MSSLPTALITGASSGIGAVYAQRLAARGHHLVLVARRAERLHSLAQTLAQAHQVQVNTLVADLAKPQDLETVAARLADDARIGLLINNAGVAHMGPLASGSFADSQAQVALNIVALMRLTQAVLPRFVAQRSGTIVNIASVLGLESLPMSAVYSGTKAFVLAYTRGLHKELAGTGVRVQAVLPSATATEIWSEGVSGVSLSSLDPATVMSATDLVDAALAGLAQGDWVTLPSVEDPQLWQAFEQHREALFKASQTGQPASRYVQAG